MFLLDANVLIALGDAQHPHGDAALRFFEVHAVPAGWATCPLTENAFLRILGAPSYPGSPGSTDTARELLRKLTAAPGHQFWPDDVPYRGEYLLGVIGHRQVTDAYLVALAREHGGAVATFDRGLAALHGDDVTLVTP
jgi:toxin-antitoxin system PIN domain toxin